MHLPSLVQCLGMICFVGVSLTGYVMDALVRRSLNAKNDTDVQLLVSQTVLCRAFYHSLS